MLHNIRLFLILFSAILSLQSVPAHAANEKITFIYHFSFSGGAAPFFYAKSQGFYTQEGLDVTISTSSGAQAQLVAIEKGQALIGDVSAVDTILAIDKGRPLVAVGSYVGKSAFGIFAKNNSSINAFTDLPGRSVVLSPSASTRLKLALRSVGVEPSSVKTIEANGSALVQLYATGQADTLYTTPWFQASIPDPNTIFIPQADLPFHPPAYQFVVAKASMENAETRKLIRAFVKATMRGIAAAVANPEAAAKAVVQEVPALNEAKTLAQWKLTSPYICSKAQLGATLGKPSVADWTNAISGLHEYGVTDKAGDVSSYMTNDLFDKENGIAVTQCF